MYDEVKKSKITDSPMSRTYSDSHITRHMDSRWYTSDLHMIKSDIETFVAQRHQGLLPDEKEILSSMGRQEVTACLTAASVVSRFPVMSFLRSPKRWNSLDTMLPTELVPSNRTTAGSSCSILPEAPMSHTDLLQLPSCIHNYILQSRQTWLQLRDILTFARWWILRLPWFRMKWNLAYWISTLKMEAEFYSEALVTAC
jgi:hypothetical protein